MSHTPKILLLIVWFLIWSIVWFWQWSKLSYSVQTLSEITNTLQAVADKAEPDVALAKKTESCGLPKEWATGAVSCGSDTANRQYEPGTIFVSGSITSTQQLTGKPSFLRRAGKFCAYCREKIPQAEKYILDDLTGKINIQLMTMFFDTQKFSTRIPQAPYEALDFKYFAGKECTEFPMWVVLDKNGKLVESVCGWWSVTIEDTAKKLREEIEK
jgi:hypothetical protein